MQSIHYQATHPRGSSPRYGTAQTVDHEVGRHTLNSVLTTRPIGQQMIPEMEMLGRQVHPECQWDEQGRWI